MTRDEAVQQIQRLEGFRTDGANTIIAMMQFAQRDLEDQWKAEDGPRPWFLLSDRVPSACTPGDQKLTYPTGWLETPEDDGLWIVDNEGAEHRLQKYDDDDLRALYGNDDPTFPCAYSEDGLYIRLYPTPDQAYVVYMKAYVKDVEFVSLGASDTNKWLTHAPNALIGRTGTLHGAAANARTASLFAAIYGDAIAAIKGKNFDIMVNNRRYAMGETL